MKKTSLIFLILITSLIPLPANAFGWLQPWLSKDDQQGLRLGYHNENPALFWRAYIGLSRTNNDSELNSAEIGGDWVVPITGTYSTVFIGPHFDTRDSKVGIHTGVTLFKYVEFGWQKNSNQDYWYGGINLAF